ncbi:MAG: hypothetical protein M3214_02705 [Actinomycetota bacterium]|nr:hypothetical protein [Actinomycetota bacterium]
MTVAPRFGAPSVLGACVFGLICVTVLGGLLMAAAETIAYDRGVWIAFNVVTSMGYGDEPTGVPGRVVTAGAFVAATTCWFGIVSVASEVGLSRFERNALVREVMRSLARRRGSKLYHDN